MRRERTDLRMTSLSKVGLQRLGEGNYKRIRLRNLKVRTNYGSFYKRYESITIRDYMVYLNKKSNCMSVKFSVTEYRRVMELYNVLYYSDSSLNRNSITSIRYLKSTSSVETLGPERAQTGKLVKVV